MILTKEFLNGYVENIESLTKLDLSSKNIEHIENDAFQNCKNLEFLSLKSNQISNIKNELFSDLKNLKHLDLCSNQIQDLNNKIFYGLINLEFLNLSFNKIEYLDKFKFISDDSSLNGLKHLFLNDNQIKSLGENCFNGLKKLKKLHLYNNQLIDINGNIFNDLNELTSLHLHSLSFSVSSNVFSKLVNLKYFTLFDEFSIFSPSFKPNFNIDKENVSSFFAQKFENINLDSEFYLSSISINSIELRKKEWKTIQSGFKWENISERLSIISGLNGAGKTGLLTLINDSLNENDNMQYHEYCVVKYFNSAENRVDYDTNDLERINKNIKDLNKNESYDFEKFLYNKINYFSLIQYFDYLVLVNETVDDLTIDENIFEYKFCMDRLRERKKEQDDFKKLLPKSKNQLDDYYSSNMKPIEFYLGLNEKHKLSTGESLILLIELWRIHAKLLKKRNQSRMRPVRNKLRIILLDEPDAHMHPSLTKKFINLLSNNDLTYLRFQVIMTSLDPITASFVESNENIFGIKRDKQSKNVYIESIKNKSELIQTISEDLLFVREKFKIVFIEGEIGFDEAFYSFVYYMIANKYEKNNIPVKFQEMGSKMFNQLFLKRNNKDSKCKVDEIVFGINDGDFNIPNAFKFFGLDEKFQKAQKEIEEYQENFKRIERYSFENYVYDPINFCFAISYLIKTNPKTSINLKAIKKRYEFFQIIFDFIDQIKSYPNIECFINLDRTKHTEIINQFLKNTSDFYYRLIDKKETFFMEFGLKELPEKMLKYKLDQVVPIEFILSDNSVIIFDYYPLLLYYPGKNLKKLQIYNLFDDLIKSTNNKQEKVLIDTFKTTGFLIDRSLYNIIKKINGL